MEESGSENLDEELAKRKTTFLSVKTQLKFFTLIFQIYYCSILIFYFKKGC